MKSRSLFLTAGAIVLSLTACESATAPDTALTQSDVNQLANDADILSALTLGDAGLSPLSPTFSLSPVDVTPLATVTTISRSFSNTRSCPVSGTVTIAGTSNGTSDPVAHNLSITTSATKTDAACAFNTRGGVLTINGNPNVALTNTVNVVAGKPSGPQTQTHKGSFTWSRAGRSGTCNVDVTSVFDPSAGTVTVNGTMCARTVNVSRTAPRFP